MMKEYRFKLEPYNGSVSRFSCPNCKVRRSFVRYLDTCTGEHVAANVGMCNRYDKCGYHYSPKQYFSAHPSVMVETFQQRRKDKPEKLSLKPVSTIPINSFKGSLQGYSTNCFVQYLAALFGIEQTRKLINQYFIGSASYWRGATVFYQIDITGKVRTGKIMLYNPNTGKRVKQPFNHITWVHNLLSIPNYNLQQCFFGEHLLKTNLSKTVAVVESEKTAVIASVYLPDYIWIAAGGKEGLSEDKCKVLYGRDVVLFPDLNGFDKWRERANKLSNIASISISDFLERKTDDADKLHGFDLADYLVLSASQY